jgi:hypothetical protein
MNWSRRETRSYSPYRWRVSDGAGAMGAGRATGPHQIAYLLQGESPGLQAGRESDHFRHVPRGYTRRGRFSGQLTGQKLAVGLMSARPMKATIPFPKGRHEAVETRQPKCEPRPSERHRRGSKVTPVDGTTRARTRRKGRPGASPNSLVDGGDARCKRIPRPSGRPRRHTPSGGRRIAHEPRHPGSAGWICPRRTTRSPTHRFRGAMAGTPPSADGETPPFTARRMSCSGKAGCPPQRYAASQRVGLRRLPHSPHSRRPIESMAVTSEPQFEQ